MPARPAAGGGRWVEVDPARLSRWLARFAERHGELCASVDGDGIRVVAGDASTATLYPPPGLVPPRSAGSPTPGTAMPTSVEGFVAAAVHPRRLGVVLARQAAVAVGLAEGDRLVASKVHTSYVQGRTAAGGWSQQRFARRRANQAKAAAGTAADIVARVLLPESGTLAAVVTGGDRRAIEAVFGDARLARLADRRSDRFLEVGEPRREALERAVAAARAVRILVRDPDEAGAPR